MKITLALLSLTMLTACQSASSSPPKPLSARSLTVEYDRSSAVVRSKYDGKEITVRGYTVVCATMPRADIPNASPRTRTSWERPWNSPRTI